MCPRSRYLPERLHAVPYLPERLYAVPYLPERLYAVPYLPERLYAVPWLHRKRRHVICSAYAHDRQPSGLTLVPGLKSGTAL